MESGPRHLTSLGAATAWHGDDVRGGMSRGQPGMGSGMGGESMGRRDPMVSAYPGHMNSGRPFPRPDPSVAALDPSAYSMPPPSPPGPRGARPATLSFEEVVNRGKCRTPSRTMTYSGGVVTILALRL
jgi:hypothetical protein